jgi:hypothetical protein
MGQLTRFCEGDRGDDRETARRRRETVRVSARELPPQHSEQGRLAFDTGRPESDGCVGLMLERQAGPNRGKRSREIKGAITIRITTGAFRLSH